MDGAICDRTSTFGDINSALAEYTTTENDECPIRLHGNMQTRRYSFGEKSSIATTYIDGSTHV